MFASVTSSSAINTKASWVLTEYDKSRKHHVFYRLHRDSTRDIYKAQLEVLHEQELNYPENTTVVIGLFLSIYLQTAVSEENMQGALGNAVRGEFRARSFRDDEVSSGSRLAQILGECEFIVLNGEIKRLSEIAYFYKNPTENANIAVFAAAAMQEAFLLFKSRELSIHEQDCDFFTPKQKARVYNDSFVCAMLDARVRANTENIYAGSIADQTTGVLTGSLVERKIIDGFLKIIENTAVYLEAMRDAMLCIYPDFKKDQDEYLCTKLVCFMVLDTISLALEKVKQKNNFSLVLITNFVQEILAGFFLKETIEDKGSNYHNLRNNFLDNSEVKEKLFKNVDAEAIQYCKEENHNIETSNQAAALDFFLVDNIQPNKKETALLINFFNFIPSDILKVFKATKALKAYRSQPSAIKKRVRDGVIYEQQLEALARQENNGVTISDHIIAGMFLLIVLSIQEGNQSGLFSTLLAVFVESEDDSTGNFLEKILCQEKFSVPNEKKPVELFRLADSLKVPYSLPQRIEYSEMAMHKAFLSWRNEKVAVNGTSSFFTPSQREWVYRYSYVCAMQDISSRAQEAKNIFPAPEVDKEMVSEFFKVIENAIKYLSELANQIGTVFPELANDEYALLRAKLVCFLVLSGVYFALEAKKISSLTEFLENTLKVFFTKKIMSNDSREQAYYLSSKFFGSKPAGLLENVSSTVSEQLVRVREPAITLLDWVRQYDCHRTCRDEFLLKNFLENHAPIGQYRDESNSYISSAEI